MNRERGSTTLITAAKGSTRSDLRLTRQPADTPRGRLHRLASRGLRAAQAVKASGGYNLENIARVREVARRGVRLTEPGGSRGARLVSYLCGRLDLALGALSALDVDAVLAVCDGLIVSLVQLDVAETTIRGLEAELKDARHALAFERDNVRHMQTMLAAEQVRTAAALQDIPAERWEEETRAKTLTADEQSGLGGGGR